MKESDRSPAIAGGIVSLGGRRSRVRISSSPAEGCRAVEPPGGDHRMAMALTVAALGARGP